MELVSIGQLAEDLRTPIHRVRYALRRRGVRPVCTIGAAGAYDRGVVAILRDDMERSRLRRAG